MEKQIIVTREDKYNYLDIAKWGKFLGIVGFVFTGFLALFGVFFPIFTSAVMSAMAPMEDMPMEGDFGGFMGVVYGGIYFVMALIYFFPSLYTYRYGVKIKRAITSDDQEMYTSAVQNLKKLFVFMGILMVIMLIIYGLILLVLLAVGATMGDMMYNA